MLTKLGIRASCEQLECGGKITVGTEKDLGKQGWVVIALGDTKLAVCSLRHLRDWIDARLVQTELPIGDGAPREQRDESDVICWTIREADGDAPDEHYCEEHLISTAEYRDKHGLAEGDDVERIQHAASVPATCDVPECRWHVEPEAEGEDDDQAEDLVPEAATV